MAVSDILYQIDPRSMVLVIFFVITFALLMFVLRKTGLGKNSAIATVIGLAISLLATYGLNRMDWDLTGFVYSLGISQDSLYIIAPILALLFVILLSRKKDPNTGKKRFSLGRFFIILGGLMMILGFMPFIYRKAFMIGVGAGLIAIGGFIAAKKKIRSGSGSSGGGNDFNSRKYRREQERQQRHEQNLAEKQNRWDRKQQEKEIARRAGKINKIRDRREKLQSGKGKEDKIWAQQQINSANQQRAQQLREQQEYEKQQKLSRKRQEKDLRKKQAEEQKWSQEQINRANRQRAEQLKEQKNYEEKQRKKTIQEQQIQSQKQQRMQHLRQKSIQNLKSLYNEKYQEAIKQQNLTVKGVSGTREKYIRLQKEMQRIVDKMNRI